MINDVESKYDTQRRIGMRVVRTRRPLTEGYFQEKRSRRYQSKSTSLELEAVFIRVWISWGMAKTWCNLKQGEYRVG